MCTFAEFTGLLRCFPSSTLRADPFHQRKTKSADRSESIHQQQPCPILTLHLPLAGWRLHFFNKEYKCILNTLLQIIDLVPRIRVRVRFTKLKGRPYHYHSTVIGISQKRHLRVSIALFEVLPTLSRM